MIDVRKWQHSAITGKQELLAPCHGGVILGHNFTLKQHKTTKFDSNTIRETDVIIGRFSTSFCRILEPREINRKLSNNGFCLRDRMCYPNHLYKWLTAMTPTLYRLVVFTFYFI